MRIKIILLIFIVGMTNASFSVANQTGDIFFQNGDFQQAIKHWETNLSKFDNQVSQRIDILTKLAAAYQAIGKHSQVFNLLTEAASLAKQNSDTERSAIVLSQLSDAWLSVGDVEEALVLADDSLADAKGTKKASILARANNSQGNALAILEHYPESVTAYQNSISFAKQANDSNLAIKVSINLL
ncbi:hypothetical protein QUF50_10115, partial [Thiotrichales bacterium HSG1]|nr:hypothetical protein [Thiotrichales bacterium HSG1]